MSRGSSSSGRGSSSSGRGSSSSHSGISHSSHHHHHSTYYSHGSGSGDRIAFLVMGIILLFFGAVLFIGFVQDSIKVSKYSSVEAECLSNSYESGYYYTTYEYEIEGVVYEEESVLGWEQPEKVGKIVTIYYLKDSPETITEDIEADLSSAGWIVISLGLLAGGTALLVTGIKKMKALKQKEKNLTGEIETAKQETAKRVKCEYCGKRYKESEGSCPDCGANLRKTEE